MSFWKAAGGSRFSISLTLAYLAFLGDLPSLIAIYDYCYEKGVDLADFSETLDPKILEAFRLQFLTAVVFNQFHVAEYIAKK